MTDLKPCGTLAAWRRHQRHREPICPECRAARNLAQNQSGWFSRTPEARWAWEQKRALQMITEEDL